MAPAASKLDTVPFNCYELGHTWTPYCTKAAADLGFSTFKEGFKIYTSCYVLSLVASRRFPKSRDEVLKVLKDLLRSSAFLSANAFGFIFFFCNIRRLKGNFNFFTMGYLPAVLAAYCAIQIEKPQRRPLLALYVANVASETIYRMLRARGIVQDIKHFDLFLFCASMVTLISYMKKGIRRTDFVDTIFTKIFGSEEFSQTNDQRAVLRQPPRRESGGDRRRVSLGGPGLRVGGGEVDPNAAESVGQTRVRDDSYRSRFVQFVLWMHRSVEDIASHLERMVIAVYEGQIHEMCPHNQPCFDYWLEGFFTRFLTGAGIQAGFQVAMLVRRLMSPKKFPLDKTGSLLSNSVLFPCIRSGLGLGGMCLAFRLFNCSFRWLKGMDGPGHAGASGVMASALGFFLLKPPSSLGVYLFFKAAEIVINDSHRKNNWAIIHWLDKIYGGGWSILYAISTATLFHTGMLEPQNLKPSYYHFLSRVTGGKFPKSVNLNLMSIYGTNSDVLMKNFWPKFNEKFLSESMKKVIKMRDGSGVGNEALKEIVLQFVSGRKSSGF